MNRTEKQELVDGLHAEWKGVSTAFLLEFRGLNVPQATKLRDQIRKAHGRYRVVKNTLAALAMKDTALMPLLRHLQGPKAIAYTSRDAIALAKVIVDFAKENPALVMGEGVLEGQALSSAQVPDLAKMPGRQELIGKLVGLLGSPMRRLVVALNAPVAKLAVTLGQVEKQKETTPAA